MPKAAPQSSDVLPLVHKPAAVVVSIDPDTATEWLSRNESNRHIRAAQVNKYSRDMLAGRWHLTGSAIQFATDGRLLDGQHRLHAIVTSGVTVDMFVVRGLPVGAQPFMDIGSKRTVSDQLGIAGYRNTAVLASGARLALRWSTDRLKQPKESTSDSETRDFIDARPSLIDAAAFAARIHRDHLDINPAVICAVMWGLVNAGHDSDRVIEFFTAMAERRCAGAGDPKNALLNRIATSRRNREQINNNHMLSMVVRTFNADYLGKPLYKVPTFARMKDGAIDVPKIVAPNPPIPDVD